MAKFILFCAMYVVLCVGVHGGEPAFPTSLTLQDGTQYEAVKLMSQTPAEVVFRHSQGVTNVKISELSEELQQLLDYSEAEAKEVEAQQAEKTALRLQLVEAQKQAQLEAKLLAEKKSHVYMVRGHVHRVLDEGIVVQAGVPTALVYNRIRVSEGEVAKRTYKGYSVARPTREFGLVYIEGHPRFEAFTDADSIDVNVYRDGIFKFEGKTMKQFVYLQDF